ncbi:MAG: condensation domain-containing protein, partial [Polyangiaceae bacterium]
MDHGTIIDLAPMQMGVWTSCVLAPGSSAFQAVVAVELLGALDVFVLREALGALAAQHPALRTTFHAGDERHALPYQCIHEPGFEVVLDHSDASAWSQAKLREQVRADARVPIDIGRGPFRVAVYARGPADHVVAFADHHIGLDLVSVELYLIDLPKLYEAALRKETIPPRTSDVAYVDFVRKQAAFLDSAAAEESLAFWAKQLAEAPMALDLPLDHPRPAVREARGAAFTLCLPPDAVDGLRGLGKSLNRTLLAVFQLLLFRYSGQTDMLTGMPADMRPGPEYGDVMGNFVNMLVLRFDLSGNPTVRELLQHVHAVVSEGAKNRHIPFPRLIERLRPKRDPSTTPFFQVGMGLQRMPRLPHLSAYMIPGSTWSAKIGNFDARSFEVIEHEGQYDFELISSEHEGRIWLGFKYNTDIFDRATVERMAN